MLFAVLLGAQAFCCELGGVRHHDVDRLPPVVSRDASRFAMHDGVPVYMYREDYSQQ